MSDQFNDAFLRQRRNLVLTSSVLLVYIGAEVKLRTFNGVIVAGEIQNEKFLISFMLILIGYFLIRFFQCMESRHQEFIKKWHQTVKSKCRLMIHLELQNHLSSENQKNVAFKDDGIKGSDIYFHIVEKKGVTEAIKKSDSNKFTLDCTYKDESELPSFINVIRIDRSKAIKFWFISWFSVSWRTMLLTEYYLPVMYSLGVVWSYLILNILS